MPPAGETWHLLDRSIWDSAISSQSSSSSISSSSSSSSSGGGGGGDEDQEEEIQFSSELLMPKLPAAAELTGNNDLQQAQHTTPKNASSSSLPNTLASLSRKTEWLVSEKVSLLMSSPAWRKLTLLPRLQSHPHLQFHFLILAFSIFLAILLAILGVVNHMDVNNRIAIQEADNVNRYQIIDLVGSTSSPVFQIVQSLARFPNTDHLVSGAHRSGTLSIGISKRAEFVRKAEISRNLETISQYFNQMADSLPELKESLVFIVERILNRFDKLVSTIIQIGSAAPATACGAHQRSLKLRNQLLEVTIEDINDSLVGIGMLIQKCNAISKSLLVLWRETYSDLLLEQATLETAVDRINQQPKSIFSLIFWDEEMQMTVEGFGRLDRELSVVREALVELEESVNPLIISTELSVKAIRNHVQTLGKRVTDLSLSPSARYPISSSSFADTEEVDKLKNQINLLKATFEKVGPLAHHHHQQQQKEQQQKSIPH